MKQIWKYELDATDSPVVRMPIGSQSLSVGMQGDTLIVWALVDPERDEQLERFRFRVAGTGDFVEAIMESWKFLGTVKNRNGIARHVWAIPGLNHWF